ncbi:hypothetical protein BO86DRAFT_395335 [Aspergillus japonicus CBS 114.51]|uniref:Uncharacterized protein n=1 Tax=Aspergillus japonicus CBS 114.51 TaxID=1448312 RepID=A0A8T8XH61_ASPJA|nr:hypothetical protein BO86DRAFT_395335 [Aspergillus japonicus CBS 114.51]RAH86719.1 hypothetical protein BO86DRAFT_395335 [Aspergillus japonicus CBS 114.51]
MLMGLCLARFRYRSLRGLLYLSPPGVGGATGLILPTIASVAAFLPGLEDRGMPPFLALHGGLGILLGDPQRASWAISDPKVYGWFKSRHSRALVIHGNWALQRISPLPFFCALLIESLQSLEPIIVLHHFCGLHPPSDHRDGELECLSTNDAQAFKGSISNLTPDFLIAILRKLIKALPRRRPVFMILDGINYYETHEFGWETKRLVKKLVKLLGAGGALYKLLITSTSRVLDIGEYFENDEKHYVPVKPTPRGVGAANQQLKRRFTFGRSAKSQ